MIKRFNEVISIISDSSQSNDALNKVQYEVNNIIHNNLYNFMLPSKVKGVIDSLTPLFIKMKELKNLPKRVDEKRNTLLAQGRIIIKKLQLYVDVVYSKEEYKEVYVKMFKRMVAQYLQAKPTLNITNAVSTLSTAKELAVAWQNDVKEELPEGTFKGMISELKTFITKDI